MLPKFEPTRLSPRPEPFDHVEWFFELKLDGFRALADKLALDSVLGVAQVAKNVAGVLGSPKPKGVPKGVNVISSEVRPCPQCGKDVLSTTYKLLSDGSVSGGYTCQYCGAVDAWGALTD